MFYSLSAFAKKKKKESKFWDYYFLSLVSLLYFGGAGMCQCLMIISFNAMLLFSSLSSLFGQSFPVLHVICRHAVRLRRNPREASDLNSLHELAREIDSDVHTSKLYNDIKSSHEAFDGFCQTIQKHVLAFNFSGLWDIVKNCTYIGLADDTFALLQHETYLYLMNVVNVRYVCLALLNIIVSFRFFVPLPCFPITFQWQLGKANSFCFLFNLFMHQNQSKFN